MDIPLGLIKESFFSTAPSFPLLESYQRLIRSSAAVISLIQ
jgi:hypothetical protein